jgi:hypothetical protein
MAGMGLYFFTLSHITENLRLFHCACEMYSIDQRLFVCSSRAVCITEKMSLKVLQKMALINSAVEKHHIQKNGKFSNHSFGDG